MKNGDYRRLFETRKKSVVKILLAIKASSESNRPILVLDLERKVESLMSTFVPIKGAAPQVLRLCDFYAAFSDFRRGAYVDRSAQLDKMIDLVQLATFR